MKNYFSPAALKFFIFPVFTFLFFGAFVLSLKAQTDMKREIAVISSESGSKRVIRYADLLIQLALEPDAPLDSPRVEDLRRALQTIINLALISLELETAKVPCSISTGADTEDEIRRRAKDFSSFEEFEKRMRKVGFHSVNDYKFEQLMSGLAALNKYLNIRFRSFIVLPDEEEEKYYRDVFMPDFRRKNPGLLLPDRQQMRPQIRRILIEQKAESEIQRFLENARKSVKIDFLNEELK
jgi:hypothetical protein